MAHVAKYKATSVGHMLAHYRRDQSSLERDNIDRGRVDLNYDVKIGSDGRARLARVGTARPAWSTVEERREAVDRAAKAEGRRATRKDAVLMADLVVTLPENVRAGDEGAFFRYTYEWLASKVGSENLNGLLGELGRRFGASSKR